MLRFASPFGRVGLWILRSVWLKVILLAWAVLWIVDRALWHFTEAAWFASVGQSERFWLQMRWQSGLFCAFLGSALLAALLVMRAIAPLGVEAPDTLPRALEFLGVYRARASRWGWLLLVLAAFLGACALASHWLDAALWTFGGWNLRGSFPATLLSEIWHFALVLSGVALVAGVLRALPSLATRRSTFPPQLKRLLKILAFGLLFLRSLGYLLQSATRGDAATSWSAIFGTFLCALTAFLLARSARRGRVIGAALIAFLLPGALRLLFSPFFPAFQAPVLSAQNSRATPDFSRAVVPENWPLWDKTRLLQTVNALFSKSNGRVTRWQSVDLQNENGMPFAVTAGAAVASQNWNSARFADRENSIQWLFLQLPTLDARFGAPAAPNFYGLGGAPLFNDRADFAAGVPFQGAWKAAWAWRLRDPLLLLEGAKTQKLLVFRGASEIARKLAPFWEWSAPVARRDSRSGAMRWEMTAYESNSDFGRGADASNGVLLEIQARDGAVSLHPLVAPSQAFRKAPWQRLFRAATPQTREFSPSPGEKEEIYAPFSEGIGLSDQIPLKSEAWTRRLQTLDAKAAQILDSRDAGTPLVWRRNAQFLVARPYFRAIKSPSELGFRGAAPGLEIVGVAVTDEKNGVGVGENLAEALADLEGDLNPKSPAPRSKIATTPELFQRALELQKSAQRFAQTSQWTLWKRDQTRATEIWQELARRHKAGAP